LVGRTPFLQPVHLAAPPHRIGEIAMTRIVEVFANSLRGEVVPAAKAGRYRPETEEGIRA